MSLDNILLPPCVEQKVRIAHISQIFNQNKSTAQKISKDKNFQEGVCEYVNTYLTFYKWFKSLQREENVYFHFKFVLTSKQQISQLRHE